MRKQLALLSAVLLAGSWTSSSYAQTPSLVAEDLVPSAAGTLPIATARVERPEFVQSQGGVVFHAGSSGDTFNPVGEVFYVGAVNAAGQELFRFVDDQARSVAAGLWAPPLGTTAFVTSVFNQVNIELRAFRSDGSQPFVLTEPLAQSVNPTFNVLISGDQAGTVIFVATPEVSGQISVRALDAANGVQLWKQFMPAGSSLTQLCTDVTGSRVFALLEFGATGFNSDSLVTLDGQTGNWLWDLGVTGIFGVAEGRALSCPPPSNLLFLAEGSALTSSRVAAFDSGNGNLVWSTNVTGEVRALARDQVDPALLVLSRTWNNGTNPALLTALRPQTGLNKWSQVLGPVGPAQGIAQQGLVLSEADRRAFVAHVGSTPASVGLAAVNLDGGGLIWSSQQSAGGLSNAVRQSLATVSSGGQLQLAWYSAVENQSSGSDYRIVFSAAASGAPLAVHQNGFILGQARPLGLSLPKSGPLGFLSVRAGEGQRRLAAFNRSNAQPLWSVGLGTYWLQGDPPMPGRRLASSPDGARVFVSVDPEDTGDTRQVLSLDGATGAQLWSAPQAISWLERDIEYCEQPGAPARVLLQYDGSGTTTGRTRQTALNASNGAVLWSAEWPPSGFATHFAGPLVQHPSSSEVAGIAWPPFPSKLIVLVRNSATGQLKFARELTNTDFGSGAVAGALSASDLCYAPDGTRLYVLVGFGTTLSLPPRFGILAIDAASGTTLYAQLLGDLPGPGTPSPRPGFLRISSDGSELIAALDAPAVGTRVTGIAALNGSLQWQVDRPGSLLDAEIDPSQRSLFVLLGNPDGTQSRLAALDITSGALLAEAEALTGSWPAKILAFDGPNLSTLSGDATVTASAAARLQKLEVPELISGPPSISLAAPEQVEFLLDRPSASAGNIYLLLGSLSGSSPGLPLPGGLILPLVPDALTTLWLTTPNQTPFVDGLDLLNSQGDARAALALPTGLNPSLAGLTAHHAFLEFDPAAQILFVSPASGFALVP
jgi:outer membrane protein assembly factor BamB